MLLVNLARLDFIAQKKVCRTTTLRANALLDTYAQVGQTRLTQWRPSTDRTTTGSVLWDTLAAKVRRLPQFAQQGRSRTHTDRAVASPALPAITVTQTVYPISARGRVAQGTFAMAEQRQVLHPTERLEMSARSDRNAKPDLLKRFHERTERKRRPQPTQFATLVQQELIASLQLSTTVRPEDTVRQGLSEAFCATLELTTTL